MFLWIVSGMPAKIRLRMGRQHHRIESESHYFRESAKLFGLLVDLIGIEPMTSSMPWNSSNRKM